MSHPTPLPPSVAAGSSHAAGVGLEILKSGGNAADAAVAMVLAACVGETVYTGLGGGGFAIFYEAATGTTTCLDFFVAVPGLGGRVPEQHEEVMIDFGGQVVPYAVGPGTVAVPGVPAGVARMHELWGSMPWRNVVDPAISLAEKGTRFGEQQASILETVADAMLRGGGAEAYAPDGVLMGADAVLHHPGLAHALEVLRDEGPSAFYSGRIADGILTAVGDAGVSEADLLAYQPMTSAPREARLGGCVVQARGNDLDDLLGVLASVELSGDDAETALRLVDALRANPRHSDTTNVTAADAAGNACAATTSLGLSSGVWLPGYGIHLNSMLGESELIRGELVPGTRMGSMMSPLVMCDDDGLCLIGGAAGGSRIRSALAQVLVRVVREGLPVRDAIAAPRLNPVPGVVHLEPGFPAEVLTALRARESVVVWPALAAYFGGVSAIDRHGPGGDPRRDGDIRTI